MTALVELRSAIERLKESLVGVETAFADAQAQWSAMPQAKAEAGAELPVEPPPLKVYEDLAQLDAEGFERWPDNDDTKRRFNAEWVAAGMLGGKTRELNWPPKRNAIIKKIGNLENVLVRPIGGKTSPDYVLICQARCVDVTMKNLAGIVQDGDDSFEGDPTDWEWLCRNYTGGLRKPLSSWRNDFQWLASVLAEARPDLIGEWDYDRLPNMYT